MVGAQFLPKSSSPVRRVVRIIHTYYTYGGWQVIRKADGEGRHTKMKRVKIFVYLRRVLKIIRKAAPPWRPSSGQRRPPGWTPDWNH